MARRAPDTLTPAPSWRDRAACRADDPDLYFDERTPAGALSCGVCPVRAQCLAEAMEWEGNAGPGDRHGIYGGLTSKARARLAGTRGVKPRRHSGGRPLAPCGTESAYNRHVRRDEPIDDRCRQAHAAEACERNRAGGAKARV